MFRLSFASMFALWLVQVVSPEWVPTMSLLMVFAYSLMAAELYTKSPRFAGTGCVIAVSITARALASGYFQTSVVIASILVCSAVASWFAARWPGFEHYRSLDKWNTLTLTIVGLLLALQIRTAHPHIMFAAGMATLGLCLFIEVIVSPTRYIPNG